MKSFKSFVESKIKPIVISSGNFNPPSINCLSIIEKASSLAEGDSYRIYSSTDSDQDHQPLDYNEKIDFMRKMFTTHGRNIIRDINVKDPIDAVKKAHRDGYNKLTYVSDDDSIESYKTLFQVNKINELFEYGVEVTGIGSKMISESMLVEKARNNDLKSFSKFIPKTYGDSIKLFNAVRVGVGLEESHNFRTHIQIADSCELRDLYITNKIFNIGESVESSKDGNLYTITERHSNYVVVEDKNKKNKKFFIKDLKQIK